MSEAIGCASSTPTPSEHEDADDIIESIIALADVQRRLHYADADAPEWTFHLAKLLAEKARNLRDIWAADRLDYMKMEAALARATGRPIGVD